MSLPKTEKTVILGTKKEKLLQALGLDSSKVKIPAIR
jgi:hypothetical protein